MKIRTGIYLKFQNLEIAFEWDGHTNNDVADRIKEYLSIMDK